MKAILILIILFPFFGFSQHPNSLMNKWKSEFENGTLDSVMVNISMTNNQFNHIDSVKMLYVVIDTLTDSTGAYAIGQLVIDPFMEYNGRKIGQWTEYYQSGKKKSTGNYTIGAITWCQFAGPTISGYSYKTGEWEYYHENGQIEAKGIYTYSTKPFSNSCGGDAYYIELTDSSWKFWDDEGNETNR